MSQENGKVHEPHIINYDVDDEPQVTTEKVLTPHQILSNAQINVENHYLVQLKGQNQQVSYKDKMDEPIHMHENMRFISVEIGETPVS